MDNNIAIVQVVRDGQRRAPEVKWAQGPPSDWQKQNFKKRKKNSKKNGLFATSIM